VYWLDDIVIAQITNADNIAVVRARSLLLLLPPRTLKSISTTAALRVASDSERYLAMSLHIVHYRSLSLTIARNAQRSAAVVKTGLYVLHRSVHFSLSCACKIFKKIVN